MHWNYFSSLFASLYSFRPYEGLPNCFGVVDTYEVVEDQFDFLNTTVYVGGEGKNSRVLVGIFTSMFCVYDQLPDCV